MEAFSALLAICAGNSPVLGEFPTQRPVTRIFDVFFDLRLNKQLSKQSWGWWFETLSRRLWRQYNGGIRYSVEERGGYGNVYANWFTGFPLLVDFRTMMELMVMLKAMEGPALHITTKYSDRGENDRDMPISIAITTFSIAIWEKTIDVAPQNDRGSLKTIAMG